MRNDIDSRAGAAFAVARAFLRPCDERGSQAIGGGGRKIAAVRGAHHSLAGFKIKGIRCREVNGGFRLEIPRKIGP